MVNITEILKNDITKYTVVLGAGAVAGWFLEEQICGWFNKYRWLPPLFGAALAVGVVTLSQ